MNTMFIVGLAVLLLIAVVAVLYYKQKEKFEVVGKFVEPIPENPGQSFTLQPMDQTYTFADPIPDGATSFDRILARFVDKTAPTSLTEGASFPEAAPYTDSEVERICKMALARVKGPDAPVLDFISVEYASKAVDSKKNAHYDLAFIVYDQVKNYSLKLVLVCIVDPTNRLYIKKFASFNSFTPAGDGPLGVEEVDALLPADFVSDFVSFQKLYADNGAAY